MLRAYSAVASAIAAGTNINILALNQPGSGLTARQRLCEVLVGSGTGTPADNATKFQITRIAAAPTGGSSPSAFPMDTTDTAASGAPYAGGTVTPGSVLLYLPLNQRATFRWIAAPDCEIVIPLTASAGLSVFSLSSTATPAIDATIFWKE